MLAFLVFILFCIGLHRFVLNNLENSYFEFINSTEREITVIIEHYHMIKKSFSIIVQPFSNENFKILNGGNEVVNIKVNDLENEANFDYYLTYGDSFFFKTKFRLEYDGKNINVIYAEKVDYWF